MKSDIASPIPVVSSFSTQKTIVISGTFVSIRRVWLPDAAPVAGRMDCMRSVSVGTWP